MAESQTISVLLDGNKSADLQVEERVFTDRSCGQYESGWRAYCLNTDTEYFISDGGEVWVQPENCIVGTAPVVKAAADKMEAQAMEAELHMMDEELAEAFMQVDENG